MEGKFPLPGQRDELLQFYSSYTYYENPAAERATRWIHSHFKDSPDYEMCIKCCCSFLSLAYSAITLSVSAIISYEFHSQFYTLISHSIFVLIFLHLLSSRRSFPIAFVAATVGAAIALDTAPSAAGPLLKILSEVICATATHSFIRKFTLGAFLLESRKKGLRIKTYVHARKVNVRRLSSVSRCCVCGRKVCDKAVVLRCCPGDMYHSDCLARAVSELRMCSARHAKGAVFFNNAQVRCDLVSKTTTKFANRLSAVFQLGPSRLFLINRRGFLSETVPGERRLLRGRSRFPFANRRFSPVYQGAAGDCLYLVCSDVEAGDNRIFKYTCTSDRWDVLPPLRQILQFRVFPRFIIAVCSHAPALTPVWKLDLLDEDSGWQLLTYCPELRDATGLFDCGNGIVLAIRASRSGAFFFDATTGNGMPLTPPGEQRKLTLLDVDSASVPDCGGSVARFYQPRTRTVVEVDPQ